MIPANQGCCHTFCDLLNLLDDDKKQERMPKFSPVTVIKIIPD